MVLDMMSIIFSICFFIFTAIISFNFFPANASEDLNFLTKKEVRINWLDPNLEIFNKSEYDEFSQIFNGKDYVQYRRVFKLNIEKATSYNIIDTGNFHIQLVGYEAARSLSESDRARLTSTLNELTAGFDFICQSICFEPDRVVADCRFNNRKWEQDGGVGPRPPVFNPSAEMAEHDGVSSDAWLERISIRWCAP
ncbi:MAG: hypothetical protein KI792_08880 [Alphaproteobacteria bacterium]|nr:hypothetical protein [Alphaproteobacteria bacterium SS10]